MPSRLDPRAQLGHAALCALLLWAAGARAEEPAQQEKYPQLRLNKRSLATLGVDDSLPPEVNAGVIPRAQFRAVLQAGIGRFLRQVRIEPALAGGRFIGWRVLELFRGQREVRVQVLRPGDTVLRVNGRSIERPEEFKAVWDSLPDARELVLEIKRGGRASKLHYGIAD